MSRLGGIVIDTENNDPRYHPWVLYFAGSITNGARNAVYGTAVGKVDFPWNNKILANTNPSTYSTSFARGMSGFTWSTMNPMIGVGDFGGTGGPIRDTPGASAAYFTSIPTIEMYSNTRDGAPDWDTTRTATERGAVTAYSLEFLGNAAVGEVLAHGANVYFSSRGLQDSTVYLASLKMREGAVADFTRNPEMDAWFIGGFTGATQGIQIVGGILPEDDTCILRMSRGQQLANSKIVGSDGQAGYDARATLFAPENNPTYTPGAINAFSVRSGLNLAGSLPTEVPIDNRAQY
jgi:hypothetical protein